MDEVAPVTRIDGAPLDQGQDNLSSRNDPAQTARGFLQQIEQALSNLVTLKIVSVVGDVSVSGAGTKTVATIRPGATTEAASTEIDLFNGHIANTFSGGFAALGGGALQAFHQTQVEKSNAIMVTNLAELQKLASALLSNRR